MKINEEFYRELRRRRTEIRDRAKAKKVKQRKCFWTRPWGHDWISLNQFELKCRNCDKRAR